MNHFKEVCRSFKGSAIHNIDIEDEQEQDTNTKTVNINSIRFNFNLSAIVANLKTLSNKVPITTPYKIHTGSDGNIMPFYIYKNLFPRAKLEQLAETKDTKIKLKTYNQSLKTHMQSNIRK